MSLILATAFVFTIKSLILPFQHTSSARKNCHQQKHVAISSSKLISLLLGSSTKSSWSPAFVALISCQFTAVYWYSHNLYKSHVWAKHPVDHFAKVMSYQNQLEAEDKSGKSSACAVRSSSFKGGGRQKEAMISPRTKRHLSALPSSPTPDLH